MKRFIAMLLAAVLALTCVVALAEATETEAPAEGEAMEELQFDVEEATPGRLAGIRIGIDPGHQEHGNNGK